MTTGLFLWRERNMLNTFWITCILAQLLLLGILSLWHIHLLKLRRDIYTKEKISNLALNNMWEFLIGNCREPDIDFISTLCIILQKHVLSPWLFKPLNCRYGLISYFVSHRVCRYITLNCHKRRFGCEHFVYLMS